MKQHNVKAWLYLLPAILFLGAFMVYPLIDVFVYSFEEGFNSASQRFFGVGLYNYSYVLHDPYFLQAVKNTFILVAVTVPVSTGLALLISVGLSSIKKLRELYDRGIANGVPDLKIITGDELRAGIVYETAPKHFASVRYLVKE